MIWRFLRSYVDRWTDALGRRRAAGVALGFVLVAAAAFGVWSARAAGSTPLPMLPAVWVSDAPVVEVWTEDTLRSGATLSGWFRARGLPPEALSEAVAALRPVTPASKLRAGTILRVRHDAGVAAAAEIHPNRDVRVSVAHVGAAWRSEVVELDVRAETVAVAGLVRGSLYELELTSSWRPTARELRLHVVPGVVEIFSWDLDFFRDLRDGDRFRALVERRVRSDGSVRATRVLAAEIVQRNASHRAVWFDGAEEYFDLSGNPKRRAFLRAPIDYRRITSSFSRSRVHPILGQRRSHLGTDYGASSGTPVHAVADGVVTRAGFWGGYGRVVELRHPNGIRTRYAHLGGIPRNVRRGRTVRQGELIGWVGSSGLASGPHLHYEMWVGGRAADPRRVDLPAGEPLPDSVRPAFGSSRDALWLKLERDAPTRAAAPRAGLR